MKGFELLLLIILVFTSAAAMANPASKATGGHFKRVIEMAFENQDFNKALAQPDFSQLAQEGALLTNLVAEAHPSQGNYIALIAGDNYGVHSDNPVDLNYRHLGDLLESAGLDWKVYAESYPGDCFTGRTSGTYARKHNPFISFTNVSQNPTRCAKIVSADQFDQDVQANALPAFSMYIPDIDNDGHNTGIDYAGKWLTNRFGALLSDQKFLQETLFIITFDESSSSGGNHVYTVLVGGAVQPGARNNQALDHASLLRLLEDEFSLGTLSRKDLSSAVIQGIWK